ncbi:MAG: N-acetylglucosamine-6-phosphate deacetylase [Boseongicola sp.]|nr:N-acetylglucosamine-6-phosphate deacetylase [Boseongicola sp.]
MTDRAVTFRNGEIFDGTSLHSGHAIRFVDGEADEFGPEADVGNVGEIVELGGDILSPGYVDLQVNGGGGVMFNDDPSVETLKRIAQAHRGLGVAKFLPTLITDTPDITRAAIEAAVEAVQAGVVGVSGLHLEGPHLSVSRKGAHDAAMIRPMEATDLQQLLDAAKRLPLLKVTVAPESVSEDQVAAMVKAGILVSLGHTDASYDTCCRYFAAGASVVTHLFNAMSQMGNREPGLVGAALASGTVSTGLIADGVHVHPATVQAAWCAKEKPGRIFLVSDAMAVAGTDLEAFELGGRSIQRRNGTLTLADGTLAGADLDLTTAIKVMVEQVGVSLEAALQSATSVPASLIGKWDVGSTQPNLQLADMVRIKSDLTSAAFLDAV